MLVVSGSADIKVTVKGNLKARVSGSGDIHYRGNPAKIDSKTQDQATFPRDKRLIKKRTSRQPCHLGQGFFLTRQEEMRHRKNTTKE